MTTRPMRVQFNNDNTTSFDPEFRADTESRIRERLSRFADRLTRIEVHLRDIDGPSTETSRGIEATLEARPASGRPLAATDRARRAGEAVNGALGKIVARLDSTFGKLDRVR